MKAYSTSESPRPPKASTGSNSFLQNPQEGIDVQAKECFPTSEFAFIILFEY